MSKRKAIDILFEVYELGLTFDERRHTREVDNKKMQDLLEELKEILHV